MFESISKGLQTALSSLTRGGKLTEASIRDGLRQVRLALLEADVEYNVATDFIAKVTKEAVGERVLKSLRPDQQIVGIVHEQLVQLMGPVDHSFHFRREGLNKIMMCGLQGSGKTTTCGKLAKLLASQGYKPMLVAADLQRPGAIEQLQIIGAQIGVPVYAEAPNGNPVQVCRNGLKEAQNRRDVNVVIFDTAGRLHVDRELMDELEQIDNRVQPDQVYLVCDAMTGQDAVKSAKAFNDALELDGVILSKLDGDTRGGAALSVKAVTGVPIKFIGVGEQLDKLDPFHPDRMAGRILGMGDVVTLFEKAQQEFDQDEMLKQQEKLLKGKFNLEDFRQQMRQMKKLGSIKDVMKMIPGLGGLLDSNPEMDADKDMGRIEAIISSMTMEERRNPDIIDRSRRHRIANGSGSEPADVNRALKDFEKMAGMMSKMSGMGVRDRMRAMQDAMSGSLMDPDGVDVSKSRSKRGPLDARAAEEKKKKARKEAKKARKRNR